MKTQVAAELFVGILFLGISGALFAQETKALDMFQSSIPEELLRPQRGEAPRYPIDTVIGPLGQGQSNAEAYWFARNVAAALLAGNKDAASLSTMNRVLVESYINLLDSITPRSFRLGGGREENDGAFSFLIRFVGREYGMTGELFVRLEERPAEKPPTPPLPPRRKMRRRRIQRVKPWKKRRSLRRLWKQRRLAAFGFSRN